MAIEPLPDESARFEVDGIQLAYERHGDQGETILFLSGVGFARLYWRPLMRYLGRRFRCLLLDSRGCGESQAPAAVSGYALEKLGVDALALLDRVGCQRAWLVGHSLGANVALEAARQAPQRIAGLCLISLALNHESIKPHLEKVLREAPAGPLRIVREHEARGPYITAAGIDDRYGMAAGAIYQPHVIKTPLSNDLAWAMAQAPAASAALWGSESAFRITGLMREIDQQPLLGQFELPVLVIAGEDDDYSLPSVAMCRDGLRNVKVVLLSHSGHHGHVEEPGRVADAIRALVEPLAPADSPRLRCDVELTATEDGARLEDAVTDYRFAVGEIEALIVDHLGQPIERAAAAVLDQLGPEYEPAQVAEAVRDFVADLSSRGLLAEGLDQREIVARQQAARLNDRNEERRQAVGKAIAHAGAWVPFYRERVAEAGIDLDAVDGLVDLARMPPTTKDDLRANFPDRLLPVGVDVQALLRRDEFAIGTSSGTTDERVQVLFDFRIGGLPERHRELWALDGGVALERGAILTSPVTAGVDCRLGATGMQQRIRGTTLTLTSSEDILAIADAEVRAIVDELTAYAPQILFTNPWYGVCLLRRSAALGLRLPPLQVVLTSYQYLTRRHRKLLAAGFGAPVFSYYGATDLGGSLIGVECSRGSMHVREDHVHLELSTAPDLQAAPGLGLVTVTTLNNPNFTLLRYQVGDLGRAVDRPCACGLGPEWGCFVFEGRRRDLLLSAAGVPITTRQVDDAVGDADLDFYQLLQTAPARFRLETIPAAGGDAGAALGRLRDLLGDVEIELRQVTRFAPEPSLKFRQTGRLDAAVVRD
ncbi:MAG: alpha/beta fold hydrolase [Deltaproteobacteria bacterium]|nr:alpha/beta fold hydrolase [Deltaproteobacteria bacterium]